MLEVSSWVLVHVGKILIKQIYMQTTLDNDITVNLTKLSFSLLNKVCHLPLFMH